MPLGNRKDKESETCPLVTDYESYGLMATFAHPPLTVKIAGTNPRSEEGDFSPPPLS